MYSIESQTTWNESCNVSIKLSIWCKSWFNLIAIWFCHVWPPWFLLTPPWYEIRDKTRFVSFQPCFVRLYPIQWLRMQVYWKIKQYRCIYNKVLARPNLVFYTSFFHFCTSCIISYTTKISTLSALKTCHLFFWDNFGQYKPILVIHCCMQLNCEERWN